MKFMWGLCIIFCEQDVISFNLYGKDRYNTISNNSNKLNLNPSYDTWKPDVVEI